MREMLTQLYLARYFDVRLIKEKKRGRLRGTLYSSHNQEAILVGSLFGLKGTDWISPIHRDMPAFFLKDMNAGWRNPDRIGMTIEEVCAQVWGKAGSPGRARDNWSHIGSKSKRIIHSTSMLAGTIPAAAGVVYADRLDGGDSVVLTYNGEGSTAQGVFHEAINFAAVHKLPVITIIENNQWAYGTPTHLELCAPRGRLRHPRPHRGRSRRPRRLRQGDDGGRARPCGQRPEHRGMQDVPRLRPR
jgi:TPP-dependent pyruvate/acetoin dehydrogenase alpha subunit